MECLGTGSNPNTVTITAPIVLPIPDFPGDQNLLISIESGVFLNITGAITPPTPQSSIPANYLKNPSIGIYQTGKYAMTDLGCVEKIKK